MTLRARRVPRRSCIGCRAGDARRALVRLVHTSDDRFRVDPTGKMAGRGAYLCPSLNCLSVAIKRKSFDRAFRCSVPPDAVRELEAQVRELLECRAAEAPEQPPGSTAGPVQHPPGPGGSDSGAGLPPAGRA